LFLSTILKDFDTCRSQLLLKNNIFMVNLTKKMVELNEKYANLLKFFPIIITNV